jgi:hypothetical protein
VAATGSVAVSVVGAADAVSPLLLRSPHLHNMAERAAGCLRDNAGVGGWVVVVVGSPVGEVTYRGLEERPFLLFYWLLRVLC